MCYLLFVFWCLGGFKANDVFCLHLGIQRSWLIVVLIILGVSSYGDFNWVLCNADCISKCFLKRRLILSDGR